MDLHVELITMIRIRLWALDTIHPAAFNETAKCSSLHAPNYALKYTSDCTRLYTPSLLDLRFQVNSQDAPKYTASTLPSTPRGTLPSTPPSTLPSKPPSLFSSTLLGILLPTFSLPLDGTQPASLTVHCQVCCQDSLKHTPENAFK